MGGEAQSKEPAVKLGATQEEWGRNIVPTTSSATGGRRRRPQGKQEKADTLRDKRRKIRERGELLDTRLAEESTRLTTVLERVANTLILLKDITRSIDLPVSESPTSEQLGLAHEKEETNTRIGSLEERLGTAEVAIQEVKQNTTETLRILQSK